MNRTFITLLALLGLGASLPAVADEAAPVNDAGLALLNDSDFDTVYVAAGADLSAYREVFVDSPTVTFRKHWQRSQNRGDPLKVRDEDVERIQNDLAGIMRRVVSEEFKEHGYRIAAAPGPGVLVVRPDIVELDLVAPDVPTAARVETYSESAGEMTLDLELVDGGTGEVLVQARDHKRDPRHGWYQWRTRPYNQAVARRMMRGWAEDMRRALEEGDWSASSS